MFVYTGLRYAFGPADMDESVAASAFSKGDVLVYDSTSSLSRAPIAALGSIDIAGIAAADSLQSFRRQVPYFKADPDTVFWSVITPGSNVTKGIELDFDVDAAGRPVVNTSSATPRVVVHREISRMNQESGVSRVLVRLIRHGGAVEHT